jgi:hypothetical protein
LPESLDDLAELLPVLARQVDAGGDVSLVVLIPSKGSTCTLKIFSGVLAATSYDTEAEAMTPACSCGRCDPK